MRNLSIDGEIPPLDLVGNIASKWDSSHDLIPLGSPETWEPYSNAPFHDYRGMIRFLNGVRNLNDDAMLLYDGLEGSGKSTLAFQTANSLDKKWNPETNLIIDYEDWEEVYQLEEKQVFILDEGGDLMFSRDSMKAENKGVIRIFQMSRIFNHVVIVCCPNIHWVDLYIRDHRALIYGHAEKTYSQERFVERGMADFKWPTRRFNWETSEWESRWNSVYSAKFDPVPPSFAKWIRYEKRKRMKVQLRQLEQRKAQRR